MTHYGNETRVFATAPVGINDPAIPRTAWCFVDTQWAEEVIAAARKLFAKGDGSEYDLAASDGMADPSKYLEGLEIPKGWGRDPGELLQSADKLAQHQLEALDEEDGAPGRKVLARIF